ncbi:hypothetical protein ACP0HM_29435 [Escherichia coli]
MMRLCAIERAINRALEEGIRTGIYPVALPPLVPMKWAISLPAM